MKKKIFQALICIMMIAMMPLAGNAAAQLPELTFQQDEQTLAEYYQTCVKAYQDPEVSFISDDCPMEQGTERDRMVLRLMLCANHVRETNSYFLQDWARLLTRVIQHQYFKTRRGEADIMRIERYDEVEAIVKNRLLKSIERMADEAQIYMNGYAYASSVAHDYLAVLKTEMLTRRLLTNDDGSTSALTRKTIERLYAEQGDWWRLKEAVVNFYDQSTTGGEWYSMKPLETNAINEEMDTFRIQMLDLWWGLLVPDAEYSALLNFYRQPVLDQQETAEEQMLRLGRQLAEKTNSENQPSEAAREAALSLREAWSEFTSSYNQLAPRDRTEGRAFQRGLCSYMVHLLEVLQPEE